MELGHVRDGGHTGGSCNIVALNHLNIQRNVLRGQKWSLEAGGLLTKVGHVCDGC